MGHNALSKRGDMKNLIYLSTVALAFAGCDSSSGGGGDGGGVVVVDAGMASNLMPGAPCAVDPTPSDLDGDMIEDVIEDMIEDGELVPGPNADESEAEEMEDTDDGMEGDADVDIEVDDIDLQEGKKEETPQEQ